jgi:lipopolysaccharide/colanic/teichoic acid biosynthesis glycosyltransferase
MMACFERLESYLVVDLQLLNVCAGGKSLVGPHMALVEYYEVVVRMSLAVVQYPW